MFCDSGKYYYYLLLLETESYTVVQAGFKLLPPDPFTLASQVLGLKVCYHDCLKFYLLIMK